MSSFAAYIDRPQQQPSDPDDQQTANSSSTSNRNHLLCQSAGKQTPQQHQAHVDGVFVVPGELPPQSLANLASHQPIRRARIRSHNSSIYFSDSDDDNNSAAKQQHADVGSAIDVNVDKRGSLLPVPALQRPRLKQASTLFKAVSYLRYFTGHKSTEDDQANDDDSPPAPVNARQQFHRRHRQFYRTLPEAAAIGQRAAPNPPTSAGQPQDRRQSERRPVDESTEEDTAGGNALSARATLASPPPRQSPAHLRKPSARRSVSRSPIKQRTPPPVPSPKRLPPVPSPKRLPSVPSPKRLPPIDGPTKTAPPIASPQELPTTPPTELVPPVDQQQPSETPAGEHPLKSALRIAFPGLLDRRDLTARTMLLGYGAETICVLAFILTTFATFQNASPKLGRPAAPPAFFARDSLVHDFPAGNLDYVHVHVKASDISLVMFYAPWSAECQHARAAFDQTARLFYRQLFFASVNCWQPGGECRAFYPRIHEWPVLMAYYESGLAIPYTGRWSAASLVRFVGSLQRPVRRISADAELRLLVVDHDAVVVARLPDLQQPTQRRLYDVFHATAVKWLERDPFQATAFAVVTGASAQNASGPHLQVHLCNRTLSYALRPNSTQESLQAWLVAVMDGSQQSTVWVQPPISKAASFRGHLRGGPLLMLFTPRNAIAASGNDAYRMLRQVALVYGSCERGAEMADIGRNAITEQRRAARRADVEFRSECQRLWASDARSMRQCRSAAGHCADGGVSGTKRLRAVDSVTFAGHEINSSKVRASVGPMGCSMGVRNVNEQCSDDELNVDEESMDGCLGRERWQSPSAQSDFVTSQLDAHGTDERSMRRIGEQRLRKQCELLQTSEQLTDYPQAQHFDWSEDVLRFDAIEAAGCQSNHSLGFVAVDSVLYNEFAEQLGVDVRSMPHRTAVVIVDHKLESTYVHSGPITTDSLIAFIQNYTQQKLQRHMRTEPDRHSERRLQRSRRVDLPPISAASADLPVRVHAAVELRDLDADTFVPSVLQSNKTVIALFYSMQCAMCTSVLHALLLTAHHLAPIRDHVDFVRIDADRNDLPWHYTVERLPTLIAFPPGQRSADSRIYPSGVATSMPNVLAFVLANLSRSVRLHGMVAVCNSVRTKYGIPSDCARNIRTEIRDDIAFSLREWRTTDKLQRRRAIIRRLQALQRLLLQMHRPDAGGEQELFAKLRNVRKVWLG